MYLIAVFLLILSASSCCESAPPRITRHDGVIVNNRVDVQRPGRVVIYYCSEGTAWYFQNGTVVPEFSSESGSLYQYQESGGDSRILYFDPFTSILQGYYFCFKNSGLSMKVSHVGVFSTLNLAPNNLTFVSNIDAGNIQMRWSVETGPGPLDYYTVKAGPLEYEISKENPTLVVDPDVLVGRGNADSVQFSVSASYAGYFYTTKESILIVNGPSNVDVTMATTSSITVEWTGYSNHIPELVTVMGFVVEYKKVSEQLFNTSDTLVQPPVEITGLSPETKYQIRVLPVLAANVTVVTTGPFLSQTVEASTLVLNETSPEPPPRVPVSANSMKGGVIGAVVVAVGVIIVGIVCIVIIVLLLLRRHNSLKNMRMTIRTYKTSPSVESNLANRENGLPFQNVPLKPYVGQQNHDIGPNRDDTAITLKSFHSSQMECEECDDGESGDSGSSDRETVSECTTAVPVRRDYANINLDPDENDVHCIDMYKFPEYVKEMHQQRQHGFERQYEELCRETEFLPYSSNVARANRIKNRFNNIFTFDHSRVVLESPDQFGSNYINASYVNGHERTRAYISAQGPIPETIADFWLMVWEQRSPVIVMLTKVEEKGRKKCEQYWLQGLGVSYDVGRRLSVTMEGYKLYAECEVREFSLTNLSHPDVPAHKVTHFLFTGWPDHGVPQHPSSLLRFIQKVRTAYGRHTTPMIVHCSAGVGRSGTFIAIDSLVQRLKTMDTVNIYGFIRDMRHCRTHMVQTLDQYAFIHDSLFDYIVCGDTSIPASQLKSKLKELKMIHPDKGKTTLHEEYQLLNAVSMSPSEEDLRLSERTIISRKNRYADKYPYAQKYLYLLGRSATRGSEYINASFVNSYCNDNEFIAAQSPMENTVDDVWQLVWQFRCGVIVNLCRREEERENMCARFWPDGKTQYDHITVRTANTTDKEDYTVYKHHVSDGLRQSTVLEVNHFHYQNWPKDGRPNISTLIMMIAEVMKVKQGRQRPMLVMCDDGMDRTGAFICIASEIEHTKLEGTLDVFQSVKLGRCQRPHLVSSQENYFLCYETLQAYIESFDGYANFKDI